MARPVDSDPLSIERGVRQRLADKIGDNMCGLWLLVPEHLRLGTWDLLRTWTGNSAERIEPRLALQLVHEAALCTNGLREGRSLTLRGFETLNGLPFLAGDVTQWLCRRLTSSVLLSWLGSSAAHRAPRGRVSVTASFIVNTRTM